MQPQERNSYYPQQISFILSLIILVISAFLWHYFSNSNVVTPPKRIAEIQKLIEQGKEEVALSEIQYGLHQVYSPELIQMRVQIFLKQKKYKKAFEDLKQLVAEKKASPLETFYFARLTEYLWGKPEAINTLEGEFHSLHQSYSNWLQRLSLKETNIKETSSFQENYLIALNLIQQKQFVRASKFFNQENHYVKYHQALCDLNQQHLFQQGYSKILALAQQKFLPALLLGGYLELKELNMKNATTFFYQAQELSPECLWAKWGLLEAKLRMGEVLELEEENQLSIFEIKEKNHQQHLFALDFPVELHSFPYPHLEQFYQGYSLVEQRALLNLLNHHPTIALEQLEKLPSLSLQGKLLQTKAFFQIGKRTKAQKRLAELLELYPTLSEIHLQLAEIALYAKLPDQAKSSVYAALKLSPENGKASYLLGKIYEFQGETTRAITTYTHTLSFKNSSLSLARLFMLLTQAGELDKAYQLFQKYPQSYPDIDFLISAGKMLIAYKDYSNALIYWNQLLETPHHKIPLWEIYWNKAMCLRSLQKNNRWLTFARKALEHQAPIEIQQQAVQLFALARAWEELLASLKKEHEGYKALKVKALIGLGRYQEAIEYYDPEDFKDIPDILRLYRLQKDWSSQITLLEKWTKKKKNRSYLEYELAEAYYYKEETKKALKRLNSLLGQDPSFLSAWMLKGEIYLKKRKFQKAIRCFEEAIQQHKTLAKAYYLKGKAHYSLQEYQKAQENYQKAVQYDSSYSRLHY